MQISAINSGMNYSSRLQNNKNQSMQQSCYAANPSFQSFSTAAATCATYALGILLVGGVVYLTKQSFDSQLANARPDNIRTALNERCPKLDAFVMPETMKMKQNFRDLTTIENARKACADLRASYYKAVQPNNMQARQTLETTADGLTAKIGWGAETIVKYTK